MSHLIDPCLRATKIAHGIRRGIDGLSPMSGLVPELRILIQEQKNVFTSMKRAAFEKDEAAKHLAIYAKTEGPDIADTLSKLSILIQKSAVVERAYSDSVGQSREYFKEIRAAEDENYSVRKRKLDLEQKLALEKAHHHSSTASVASDKASSARGPELHPELHPEMKVFRQETMLVENELEDAKRKKIKQATLEQLEALERWGKEMVVIAHYGRQIMAELDDTPTPAGIYVDDRHATYDGTAKTAYAVKACLDTLQSWATYKPQVTIHEIDLGDFPKDNNQAVDAMLKDLANKTGSDWYNLQSPSSSKAPSTRGRSGSDSSTGSASPRNSMSSVVTTTTYIDGRPVVQVINEIPPTPESEDVPAAGDAAATAQESAPVAAEDSQPPVPPRKDNKTPEIPATTRLNEASALTTTDTTDATQSSPFASQSSYKPATTYQPGYGHDTTDGRKSPSRSRPQSAEQSQAPHPLMMRYPPNNLQQQKFQQQQQQPFRQLYPPGPPGGAIPTPMSMPIPMPMPMPIPMSTPMSMPISMPMPHIPNSPPDNNGGRRRSQPIEVSFPLGPSPPLGPVSTSISTAISPSPRPPQQLPPRNPQAITSEEEATPDPTSTYDGPPPDYAEAAMQPPAEKRDEKRRR